MSTGSQKLIIFVKAPRPGFVKTRLAASLGTKAATLAYRALVNTLVGQLAEIATVELRFTPDDALADIQPWMQPGWTARPQGAGDLGQRLDRAFSEAFAERAEKVVIIGSDCPWVTPHDIRDAWAELAEHDLVLGPASDGGYWLIGLRRLAPSLFQNIAWSTGTVRQETLKHAQAAQLRVHVLRELRDIDTEDDWAAFAKAQGAMPALDRDRL